MGQNIAKCGNCEQTNYCGWYRKDAPHDRYGRIERDYMDNGPTAYCSEECRDTAADREEPVTTVATNDQARAAVHRHYPQAIGFESTLKGDQRIGWTFCLRPGVYGWILTTGRISTVMTSQRERAERSARLMPH